MRHLRRAALGAAVLVTVACGASRPARATADPNVITVAELEGHHGVSARRAIERLRPRFLRVRGPSSVTNPAADRVVVYVDQARMGGVDILDQIPAQDIQEIRYLSAADATSRYGTGHSAGAILITTK